MSYRGHTLVKEKSRLYQRGRVLRDPLTLKTVGTFNSESHMDQWARQNGYSLMEPVKNFDLAALEEPI